MYNPNGLVLESLAPRSGEVRGQGSFDGANILAVDLNRNHLLVVPTQKPL